MLDFKESLLDRALKKNKKICLPEESDKRVKSAKKHLLSLGFEIINYKLWSIIFHITSK